MGVYIACVFSWHAEFMTPKRLLPPLKYNAKDTRHDTTTSHIVLISGQSLMFTRYSNSNTCIYLSGESLCYKRHIACSQGEMMKGNFGFWRIWFCSINRFLLLLISSRCQFMRVSPMQKFIKIFLNSLWATIGEVPGNPCKYSFCRNFLWQGY